MVEEDGDCGVDNDKTAAVSSAASCRDLFVQVGPELTFPFPSNEQLGAISR